MNSILGVAWENIFVGLLGAAIVGVVSFLSKYIKNKIIERKFPVAGEYLTKYEDELDGEKINYSAPAVLKQNGDRITGYTYMQEDDRKWIIEGQLSANGHIHGLYNAEDPLDMGIGNFFLKIDHNKNMSGLWSGYDSVNQKITSGKYQFFPIVKNYTIIDLERVHIPQLLEISDNQLGKDYLSFEDLDQAISNRDKFICKVAFNRSDNKIMAFCLCPIIEPNNINTIIKLSGRPMPRSVLHSELVGIIKTVAVGERYQGRGIGRNLTSACYKELLQKRVQSICSVAWKQDGHVNIGGILISLGLKVHVEISDYWMDDSLEKGYDCPECGQPPCHCTAVIYIQSV